MRVCIVGEGYGGGGERDGAAEEGVGEQSEEGGDEESGGSECEQHLPEDTAPAAAGETHLPQAVRPDQGTHIPHPLIAQFMGGSSNFYPFGYLSIISSYLFQEQLHLFSRDILN